MTVSPVRVWGTLGKPSGPGGTVFCYGTTGQDWRAETSDECPCTLPTAKPAPPDEDEDGFAIVGPIDNPGGAQERSQDLYQAWGQLVHLIEEEERAAAGSEVSLDPALQILLWEKGKSMRVSGDAPPIPDFFPKQELISFPGRYGLPESIPIPE